MAAADAGARWTRVIDAIGTLPEAERQVLLLFAWEELSYDEIALAPGIPVGTVRSRLSRGRSRASSHPVYLSAPRLPGRSGRAGLPDPGVQPFRRLCSVATTLPMIWQPSPKIGS